MAIEFTFTPNSVPVFSTIMGLFLVLFGLSSAFVKERLYLSEAVLTTTIGTVVGPHILGLFVPQSWADLNAIILEATRLIIAMQIMAAVVCLPMQYYRIHWKSMLTLLGPVMVTSWLVTAGLVHFILGTPLPISLAIGATLSPTDPILANSIVKGKFAEKHVPRHVRHLISAESAANDSTAALFIQFSLYLINLRDGSGVIYGILVGYIARRALKYAEQNDLIDQENFLAFSLALSIFVDGSAVPSLSMTLLPSCVRHCLQLGRHLLRAKQALTFQEILDNLANAWVFVLNGSIIPWPTILAASSPLMPRFWQYLLCGLAILACAGFPSLSLLSPHAVAHHIQGGRFAVISSIVAHGTTIPLFKLGTVAVRTLSAGSSLGRRSRSIARSIRSARPVSGVFSVSAPINARPMYSSAGLTAVDSPHLSAAGTTLNVHVPGSMDSGEKDMGDGGSGSLPLSAVPPRFGLALGPRETTIEIREAHEMRNWRDHVNRGEDDDDEEIEDECHESGSRPRAPKANPSSSSRIPSCHEGVTAMTPWSQSKCTAWQTRETRKIAMVEVGSPEVL
ncbi:Sodium/hydrogen exchanger family-domain-containing protein [Catenaria anguillulae PL171]|uniref:Sodium/hydrogen exchanger family-domain-containing protein n=1 Tax=Catenaria anguillulae PL171 TaxID=765915 RepID=A0A1Y2I409_9FUNG|nr:Sodium/hydrogen exchanger family-domain-containing protein [Catenaria anguillulae PL171]